MGSSSSCITECGGSDCRPLVQRLLREPEDKETISMQRYEHAEATATPDTTVESTWGSQMPPLPPVLPGLVLHDGYLEDESLEMPEDPLDRQEISGFIRDLVRGRTLPVLAVNGTAVECFVAMDKQLRYMVIQRTGKKEAKRRALALETVDQVCIGQEAMEESGLPLTELCVCLLLTEGQAVAFVLQNTMVNALEQQAELSDLKRQLDGATAQGRRQEHRLRQHRTSLRELIRQLEEVEERVDGVQRRVDTVSKSIHRSAEAVGVQERRAQQLDQLANSSALKRGASAALAHGSPDAKTNKASRLDMKIDDKLEELERRLWHATQDFDRRLVEEAERRAAAQEEVLGVLGQGVQQMRSEQARHASELNDNLRAEQRRWRQCISDAQAQQDEQQKHIEGLEARLDAAVEALSLEYQSMRAALPKLQHAGTSPRDRSHKHHEVPSKGQEAPTKGHDVAVKGHEHGGCGAAVTVVTQGEASNSVAPEHFRAVHDETRLHTNHHHPNPDILIRLEALEGRYRDTRGQASVENSPRARVEVTNPPDAHSGTGMWSSQTMTSPNALNNPPNGLPQGLGLTPPAGLTVEPMRLAHAHLPTVPAVSTTPEPPWQHAKPQLAPSWLDARPSSSQSVSPRSPKHNDELFELQAHRMDVSARYPGQSLQAQPEVQKPKPHSAQPRQSLSPDSPALPWSPIGGTLAPKAVSNKPSGRDQSSPNSPSPNLGRNTPPLEPPMPHPSYPQPARLPAPPPGGSMTWECFA